MSKERQQPAAHSSSVAGRRAAVSAPRFSGSAARTHYRRAPDLGRWWEAAAEQRRLAG